MNQASSFHPHVASKLFAFKSVFQKSMYNLKSLSFILMQKTKRVKCMHDVEQDKNLPLRFLIFKHIALPLLTRIKIEQIKILYFFLQGCPDQEISSMSWNSVSNNILYNKTCLDTIRYSALKKLWYLLNVSRSCHIATTNLTVVLHTYDYEMEGK